MYTYKVFQQYIYIHMVGMYNVRGDGMGPALCVYIYTHTPIIWSYVKLIVYIYICMCILGTIPTKIWLIDTSASDVSSRLYKQLLWRNPNPRSIIFKSSRKPQTLDFITLNKLVLNPIKGLRNVPPYPSTHSPPLKKAERGLPLPPAEGWRGVGVEVGRHYLATRSNS